MSQIKLISLFFLFLMLLTKVSAQTLSLSESEQKQFAESVGLQSAYNFNESFYPLGGYPGYRFDLNFRNLSLHKLRSQSSPFATQNDLQLTTLSFSKGIYENIDFYFSFTPLGTNSSLTGFGGGLRYGFYELKNIPLHFSLSLSGQNTNFYNNIVFTNQSFDLISQYTGIDWYTNWGFGQVTTLGRYKGGSQGVTISQLNENQIVSKERFFITCGYNFNNWVISINITHVIETNGGLTFSYLL